jgi:hypothetical protein
MMCGALGCIFFGEQVIGQVYNIPDMSFGYLNCSKGPVKNAITVETIGKNLYKTLLPSTILSPPHSINP